MDEIVDYNISPIELHSFISDNVVKYIKSGKVLEAGCGSGYFGIELSRKGFEVIGVDISENMVKSANQNACENYHAIIGDLENLNLFEPKKFDGILCVGVLHHFPEIEKSTIINNFNHWLKDEGFIFMLEPNGSNPFIKMSNILGRIYRKIYASTTYCSPEEIIHGFKKYDSVFKKSGFTEIYKQNIFDEGEHKLKGWINIFIKIRWILVRITKILPFPYSGNGLLIIFGKMGD